MAAAAAFCAALLAFSLRASAQGERKTTIRGNDEIVTEALSVGDFTELHTRGMFDVTFVQGGPGEKARAEVTTSSNIVPFITAETRDGVLTLGMSDRHRYFVKKIQVTVWAPVLRGVSVQGTGNLLIPGGLATDAFEAVVKGAGNLSAGEMDVDGKVSFLIQGAGDIRAEAVEAETLSAEVQGAGGIYLSGIEATDASAVIKGAGGIVLSGKAGSATLKLFGAGSIDIRGLKADNYDVSRSGIGKVKR
ncbi:MAG: DUF2807 domain-containing protein [Bacteroidales bacterium]|nr:DUF2807 domain-containing protein [Bacteroidales bacterium]